MQLQWCLTVCVSLIAAILPTCWASSFVYEDILAYPRYRVVLSEKKVPESAVFGHSASPSNEADQKTDLSTPHHKPKANEQAHQSQIVMRSSFGQPFLCKIPTVKLDQEKTSSKKSEPSAEDIQKSIDTGLKLLEPMNKGCLYLYTRDYWTYEYCHMKHVRQFHIDRSAMQGSDPVPARQLASGPNSHSFYLGFYSGKKENRQHGAARQQSFDLDKKAHKQQHEPDTLIRHVGDQRFLTQRWGGGTLCDLTGKPRSIEIQYHCDMNAHDRISMFQEVATCHYQMIISTPRLCQEMMLASQFQSDANRITCDPIVPDHQMVEEGAATQKDTLISSLAETAKDPPETNVHQKMDVAEDTHQTSETDNLDRESLLSMIDELTVRIGQLQQHLGINDPHAFQDELDVAFYHVDDNGALVHADVDDNAPMRELVESYVKMLDARKSKDENEEEWSAQDVDVTENEDQRKNKEAYTRRYP